MPTPRHCLCVLGMHRSGTSALAGLIRELGAGLGNDLLPPAHDNPRGFFESRRAVGIDSNLHMALGQECYSPLPLPEGWQRLPAARIYRAEMDALFAEEFAHAGLIALKDPRMCILFPLWREALTDAGIACDPVLILRPPLHVARSLAVRDGMPFGHALAAWLRYVLDSEAATRGMPRVLLSFRRLLRAWRDVAADLEAVFGIRFPALAGEDSAAGRFLSPDMDHQSEEAAPYATPEERDLLAMADALYATLTRDEAARGPVDTGVADLIGRAFRMHLKRAPEAHNWQALAAVQTVAE